MEEAVMLSVGCTPVGRSAGSLKEARPEDLAAPVIAEAVHCAKSDPGRIEQVILGGTNQLCEDILESTYAGRCPRVVPERSL